MGIWTRLLGFFRQVAGLILPVLAKARDWPGLGPGLR